MKLLLDRLLVRRAPLTSEGGIVIPEKAGEKSDRGEVVRTGPGRKDAPMTVRAGDKVLFDKHAGQTVEVDGEELIVLYEGEVIGILS
jgi:chaperonin GroES